MYRLLLYYLKATSIEYASVCKIVFIIEHYKIQNQHPTISWTENNNGVLNEWKSWWECCSALPSVLYIRTTRKY